MNSFFKTFFICLVLCLGFLAYKFMYTDSYEKDLDVSKTNPVFGMHKNADKNDFPENHVNILPPPDIEKEPDEPSQEPKEEVEKYSTTCYFYSNKGQLIPVKRPANLKPTLENSIYMLLKGPMIAETKKGYYSEIPANVDLISLKRQDNSLIVNLTSNFGNGGGSQSIENRVKQLSKTIKLHEPKKNIYLYINGKEVEYLGGDGVYIKQPLD